MAGLDIAETRLPQDGRIEIGIGGRPVDLRVSTLPTLFGESCVIRELDRSVVSLDLAQDAVPQYSLYVPNLRHDGHQTGIREADAWLQAFLTPRLVDPHFMRRTLLVVTFDEDSGSAGNHIYTVLVGDMVQPRAINGNLYNHYSLLRLIEDNYGVGTLGREDAKATSICCPWKR